MIDPRALATAELRSGETLLWSGQSDPRVLFTGRDAFLIPFSVLWCGFIVFWLTQAISTGAPWFFAVIGSQFALMGLHLLIGRFVVKRRRKLTEAYAVTNRRAFITNGQRTSETSVGRDDRETHWSKGRTHCSVEWRGTSGSSSLGFGRTANAQQVYANTGLDGFFGPRIVAFWDVPDGEALMSALERAA
ncbi:hypothetical protein ACLBWP_04695 [Microbacterium sp. M1A1_1b]